MNLLSECSALLLHNSPLSGESPRHPSQFWDPAITDILAVHCKEYVLELCTVNSPEVSDALGCHYIVP